MEQSVVPKRPREESEESQVDFEESLPKRQKPYNHIISLLESEEEESYEDLSPLMTTLQQEISCPISNDNSDAPQVENDQNNPTTKTNFTQNLDQSSSSTTPHDEFGLKEDEEVDDKERVMRHLLQASDDELGIPSAGEHESLDFGECGFDGGDGFSSSLCDNLWELEDEAANYYALLQSELFLWGQ